jgi:hypothetical protein
MSSLKMGAPRRSAVENIAVGISCQRAEGRSSLSDYGDPTPVGGAILPLGQKIHSFPPFPYRSGAERRVSPTY